MTNNQFRISIPRCGIGPMSDMVQFIFGKTEDNWIIVEELKPYVFTVVDENLTSKYHENDDDWYYDGYYDEDVDDYLSTRRIILGFSQWDEEVDDLDTGFSEESQRYGMSCRLIWQDVYLTPYEFRASSLVRLIEAFNHVAICAWCP